MRKKLVYICSPCRGDTEKNIIKAQGYCREAADLFPDVIPIAPHVYCTQFYDETNPDERQEGMKIGLALLNICDEIWVYGMENPSEGMRMEIGFAKLQGIPIRDAADVIARGKTGKAADDGELIISLAPVMPDEKVALLPVIHLDLDTMENITKWLRRNPGKNYELSDIEPDGEDPGGDPKDSAEVEP